MAAAGAPAAVRASPPAAGAGSSSRSRRPHPRRSAGPALVVPAGWWRPGLAPGVGVAVNGSSRWLGVGALRFQPSELAKLALLLYAADLLSRRAANVGDWRAVLRPVGLVFCF